MLVWANKRGCVLFLETEMSKKNRNVWKLSKIKVRPVLEFRFQKR